jgi:hypothetical protein
MNNSLSSAVGVRRRLDWLSTLCEGVTERLGGSDATRGTTGFRELLRLFVRFPPVPLAAARAPGVRRPLVVVDPEGVWTGIVPAFSSLPTPLPCPPYPR